MSSRRTVQIVSHGPSCLDGVMAAAAVARYYAGERVLPTLAGNNDSDRVLQALSLKSRDGNDEIWITDLSWTAVETAEHLRSLIARGARVYWIDHHRTAVSRADAPEFKVPFADKVLSEQYSAALLTFNYLKSSGTRTLSDEQRQAYESFLPFVQIADDHEAALGGACRGAGGDAQEPRTRPRDYRRPDPSQRDQDSHRLLLRLQQRGRGPSLRRTASHRRRVVRSPKPGHQPAPQLGFEREPRACGRELRRGRACGGFGILRRRIAPTARRAAVRTSKHPPKRASRLGIVVRQVRLKQFLSAAMRVPVARGKAGPCRSRSCICRPRGGCECRGTRAS